MRRSEINTVLQEGLRFLERMRFQLPPFAHWTPAQWRRKGPECREIVDRQLGWDITDFGSGDFEKVGLFLLTLRNGTLGDPRSVTVKSYAEKVMIVREGQLTPTHFHFQKMEDIINRGGGNLMMRLWRATPSEGLSSSDVTLSKDGVRVTCKAGGLVRLRPGESVCLSTHLYHCFWGEKGRGAVLVGEVSRVNDDRRDNRFLNPIGRFPVIAEDAPPLRLLVGDYAKWCGRAIRK
jgi:D-lyxose ketol-isomerase